jgi:hypothetical protein
MTRLALVLALALAGGAVPSAAAQTGATPTPTQPTPKSILPTQPAHATTPPLTKEELEQKRKADRERDLAKRLAEALAVFAAKTRPSVPLEERLAAVSDFLRAARPLAADPSVQGHLVRALSDAYARATEPELRDAIVDGLVALKPRDALAFLCREAQSAANPPDRIRAIRALQKWRSPLALPFLHAILRDPDPNVLQTDLDALLAYSDPSSVLPLAETLQAVQGRRALAPPPDAPPYPVDAIEAQIVGLLQKISGEDIDADPGKWRKWWTDKGQAMRPKTEAKPGRDPPGAPDPTPDRKKTGGKRSRPGQPATEFDRQMEELMKKATEGTP